MNKNYKVADFSNPHSFSSSAFFLFLWLLIINLLLNLQISFVHIKRPLAWIISHDEVNMVLNIIFKSDNNTADKYNIF